MNINYHLFTGNTHPAYIPEIELQSPEIIRKYQEKQLADLLPYLTENSAFYRDLFQKNNIDISKIRKIEDLCLIPPTTKDDLQLHNDAFLCSPRHKVIDYITTSGTLGRSCHICHDRPRP